MMMSVRIFHSVHQLLYIHSPNRESRFPVGFPGIIRFLFYPEDPNGADLVGQRLLTVKIKKKKKTHVLGKP